jgi:hypothetical protein
MALIEQPIAPLGTIGFFVAKILCVSSHHRWAIDTFALIEFGDAFSNFRAGLFDPDLLFAVETCEKLEGDSQDFFSVGIAASGGSVVRVQR